MNLQFQSRGFPFYKVNFLALLKKKKLCNLHNRIGALASMLAATAAYTALLLLRGRCEHALLRGGQSHQGRNVNKTATFSPCGHIWEVAVTINLRFLRSAGPGIVCNLMLTSLIFLKYCGMARKVMATHKMQHILRCFGNWWKI